MMTLALTLVLTLALTQTLGSKSWEIIHRAMLTLARMWQTLLEVGGGGDESQSFGCWNGHG